MMKEKLRDAAKKKKKIPAQLATTKDWMKTPPSATMTTANPHHLGEDTPTAPTYANVVSDTKTSDKDTGEDGSVATEVATNGTKRLAQVFAADLQRKNTVFYDLSLRGEKDTNGVLAVATALKKWFRSMQELDDSFLVYTFDQQDKSEKDAWTKPNALPQVITKMQKYVSNLRAKTDGSVQYLSVRIGFDDDEDNFRANLRDCLETSSTKMFRKSLQTAFTVSYGWLLLAPQFLDCDYWREFFEEQINALTKVERGLPRLREEEQIKMGLRSSFIWDGTTKAMRDKGAGNSKTKKGTKGIHIEFKRGQEKEGARKLRMVLKSEQFKAVCNLPMRVIPRFNKNATRAERTKLAAAVLKQGQALSSLGELTLFECDAIDRPAAGLGGKTLRELLMAMTTEDGSKRIFMTAEAAWRGGFTVYFPKQWEGEARERLSCLGAYLLRDWGDEALKWFTPEAQAEAVATKWHPVTNRPITLMEMELDEADDAATMCDWIQAATPFGANPPDLQRPGLQQLQPPIESIQIPAFNFDGTDATLSTFGGHTASNSTAPTHVNQPKPRPKAPPDDASVVSRVSVLESSLENLDSKLDRMMNMLLRTTEPSLPLTAATTATDPTMATDPMGAAATEGQGSSEGSC